VKSITKIILSILYNATIFFARSTSFACGSNAENFMDSLAFPYSTFPSLRKLGPPVVIWSGKQDFLLQKNSEKVGISVSNASGNFSNLKEKSQHPRLKGDVEKER
jgi:hypothetical protein